MDKYLDLFKELLIEYTPRVITAIVILIIGLIIINLIINDQKNNEKKRVGRNSY